MTSKQNNAVKIVMGIILIAGMLILAKMAASLKEEQDAAKILSENTISSDISGENAEMMESVENGRTSGERQPGQICIVIDPGHGGSDPGKVGVNNALEKDINLQMAFLLKERLEAEGYYVIMTRCTDESLSEAGSSNPKLVDLQNRIRIITQECPMLVVSIHQNSYTQESICGAQTFYYEHSEEGRLLAECIQNHLLLAVDDGNHRQIKGNTSYFLLKKTPVTTVIVECGFLSNWREAELLVQEEYQRIMVDAIAEGILEYVGTCVGQ